MNKTIHYHSDDGNLFLTDDLIEQLRQGDMLLVLYGGLGIEIRHTSDTDKIAETGEIIAKSEAENLEWEEQRQNMWKDMLKNLNAK